MRGLLDCCRANRGVLWVFTLLIALGLAGCGGGGDSNPNTSPPPATGTVSGLVVAAGSGQALSGVAVSAGGRSTTTDVSGRYTLTSVPAANPVVIRFDRAGYARGLSNVVVAGGGSASANPRLTPVAFTGQFNAASGTVASVPNSQAQVSLPPAALVNAATGAPASGTVNVELAPIDPAADPANMPGNFQATSGGARTTIESFGALSVVLTDNAGNTLNLAAGHTATIRIPVATRAPVLPSTMPLYYLDESTGLWVEQGTANLKGVAPEQYYEGSVSHFTIWNIDRATETLFLTGCAEDPQGRRQGGVNVETNGVNYSGSASALTDGNGNFSVAMMRGSGVATVYGSLGNQFTNVVQVGPSGGNIALSACLRLSNGSTPPQIVQHPSDQAVPLGMMARFTAQAVGGGTLQYQWKRNGAAIAGATAAFYAFTASAADNNATFSVVVTNGFGSAESNAATLTVGAAAPPTILAQPADQNVQVGATATFAVQAVAFGGTLSYQWLKNGAPIAGATGSSHTTPPTALADDGTLFSVVVTSTVGTTVGGTITSNSARLSVGNATAPAITQQPQDVSVNVGQSGVFSVVATGTPVPTYQWSRDGVAINGATSATYSTPPTQLSDSGATFSVLVSNALGSVQSGNARLTVTQPTGGAGYYLLGGAGPITDASITYANGAQTVPAQALMGVREDAPGSAVTVETTGGTGIITFSAFEATISGDQVTKGRSRISTYIKDGRLWKVDQVVTSGAPTPQRVSTLTPAELCGASGLPMLPFLIDGNDWKDATRGWLFMRAPGSDQVCNSPDDTFRAVRMNMSDTTVALTIGEPLAQIRGADGSFAGLVVRNGNQVQQLNADLGGPVNLFTVDPVSFVNAGNVFGSAPPGLWLFVDSATLYGVNLTSPGTRVPLTTLAAGETVMSHLAADGASAYVAINTATAGRVLRVAANLSVTTVTTLDAPATNLVLSSTRVVLSVSSTPARVVAALKTGSTMQTIHTASIGDLVMMLIASGENVYLTKFGTLSTIGSNTVIVGTDGSNPQTIANARLLHPIGPETFLLSQGLARTYAVVLATGETATGMDAGATLSTIEGATRNTLATHGTFPATTAGQAVMFNIAPMQYRETGLVPFIGAGASVTTGDLYFIKSDAAGLTRVTSFLP